MSDAPYIKTKPDEFNFEEIAREGELRRKSKVHIPRENEKRAFGNETEREESPTILRSYTGQFCTHCKQLLGPDRVIMRMAGTREIRAHYHKYCAGIVEKKTKELAAKIRSDKFWSAQPQFHDDTKK